MRVKHLKINLSKKGLPRQIELFGDVRMDLTKQRGSRLPLPGGMEAWVVSVFKLLLNFGVCEDFFEHTFHGEEACVRAASFLEMLLRRVAGREKSYVAILRKRALGSKHRSNFKEL